MKEVNNMEHIGLGFAKTAQDLDMMENKAHQDFKKLNIKSHRMFLEM